MQHMFNLYDKQTTLQTTLMDIDDKAMMVTPTDTRDSLNL